MEFKSKFGVFKIFEEGRLSEVHVCGCDEDGHASPFHSIDIECQCEPDIEIFDDSNVMLVIHKTVQ